MRKMHACQPAWPLVALALAAGPAFAQIEEDWAVFTDQVTNTQCDVVNGSNAEFVVLFESGNLATIAGIVLVDLVVDIDDPALPVTFNGDPVGFLDFREDGDGLPTLFWLTLGETVVGIDTFNSEPFDSGQFPEDRTNTLCDACEVIDSSLCDDGGDDDDFPPFDLLCGAGSASSILASLLLMPLIPRAHRRR